MNNSTKMFKLEQKNGEWVLIYTQKHSEEDISYMGDLLDTVNKVRLALLEDKLFSIFQPNMADTLDLLSALGEIEKCTSWNMFDVRDVDEIVSSLTWMLSNHDIYDINGIESRYWK